MYFKKCDKDIFLVSSLNMSDQNSSQLWSFNLFTGTKLTQRRAISHSWSVDGGDVETSATTQEHNTPNTWATLCCGIFLFSNNWPQLLGCVIWGARWPTDEDLRASQCLHWLVFDHPCLSSSHHEKKKKALLIINWAACILSLSRVWAVIWVDFHSAPVSTQCSCLVRVHKTSSLYTSKSFTSCGIYWPGGLYNFLTGHKKTFVTCLGTWPVTRCTVQWADVMLTLLNPWTFAYYTISSALA